jgi:putative ABC transport system permease protein
VPEPRWRRYLRFWRSNVASDVDDELAFHLQEKADELVAAGRTPQDARDEALYRFGDLTEIKDTCRTLAVERENDMRRLEFFDAAKQDITYALRTMRSHPAFTAAIVLTLALGIGATTSIFSVVNAVLLRPLPYADADRIVMLRETMQGGPGSVTYGTFNDWTTQSQSFSSTGLAQGRTYNLTDAGDPTRYAGARVTPGFFKTLYTPPALGRYFLDSETEASRVVVLSHELWQTQFSGDSAIVGKEITLNGQRHTVVGVASASRRLSVNTERLWTIFTPTPQMLTNYGAHIYRVFAKIKPGVTFEQAKADVERIMTGIVQREPVAMKDRGTQVDKFAEVLVDGLDTQLWVLLGAVTFVLLIGCVNVASLLLARATTRRKEIAIRGALGGARVRLIRQMLTESLLLAMIGGALGLLVAWFGVRFLVSTGPTFVPRLADASLDLGVLGFAAAATLVCGVLFGLAPALRATRVDLQSDLRDGGRGSRGVVRDRVRASLIVAEFAVALVLLVGAGLFIRSAYRLQQITLGFEPDNVAMLRLALPADRYDSANAIVPALSQLIQSVRNIPGVQVAAAGTRLPMWGSSPDYGIYIEGRGDKQTAFGHLRIVTPGYMAALGIPIRKGRDFNEGDIATSPRVVLVNETFARRVYGDTNPIGRRFSGWEESGGREWREIVGVVGDVRAFGQEADVPSEVYAPYTQANYSWWSAFQRTVAVVAKAPGAAVITPMRAAVRSFDPQLPVFDAQAMDEVLAQANANRRFNTLLLSLLGATGLILAAIGIYGVIAFFVSQRTQEIGVRVALGASTGSVIRLVMRQALGLALLGIVIGGIASWWGTRVLNDLLFQTTPKDPLAFAAGAGLLLVVALGASLIPARRAARVDPVQALTSS